MRQKHRSLFRFPLQGNGTRNEYRSAVGAEHHSLVLFRPLGVGYRLDRNESGQQKKTPPVSTTGSCIGRGASDCHRVRSGSTFAIAGAFLGHQTRGVHRTKALETRAVRRGKQTAFQGANQLGLEPDLQPAHRPRFVELSVAFAPSVPLTQKEVSDYPIK
jgi:hypothetical protein